jgi:hypothetical protein
MLQNGMIYRKFKSVLVDQEINARMPTPQEEVEEGSTSQMRWGCCYF